MNARSLHARRCAFVFCMAAACAPPVVAAPAFPNGRFAAGPVTMSFSADGRFRVAQGDSLLVGYKRTLILDTPRQLDFSASGAYYTGLSTLPGFQNVNAQVNNIFVARAGLKYADLKQSGGAVDREQGIGWNGPADRLN